MDRVAEGTVLAGKYALVAKLGQGGMGAVWRAEHVQLRSPVAIKLIDQAIAQNPEALGRFMREAQSAAALRSPHVVQILDFGADQGIPYIAMELLEGESLASRIERTHALSPIQTAHVITQVSRAIAKAHEAGIVHRDLKPDNIFIVRNDEEEVAKVLDFGIAKAQNTFGVTTGSATRTGAVLGTPYYMSPEQAEGNRHVDHRTDLWALGVIAFECLTGRRPFDSDALGSLLLAICTRPMPIPSSHGRVPYGFDAWFSRACARDLGERFQSARELAAELRRVCGDGVRDSRDVLQYVGSTTTQAVTGGATTPRGAPTANTYSTSVGIEKSRTPVAALVLGGVFAATAIAGGVAFVLKQRADSAAAAEAASSSARGEPTNAVTAGAEPPLGPSARPVEVAPVPAAVPEPSAAPAPSASTAPVVAAAPRAPVAGRRPARTAAAAPKEKAPASAPPPAKPPAEPAPTAAPQKPSKGVNLGI
jgi:serine/threonine-protein kinase